MSMSISSFLERHDVSDVEIESLRDVHHLPTIDEVEKIFGSKETSESRRRWDEFCHNNQPPVLEVLTKEFVVALGRYLSERGAKLGASESNPLTVLEIGSQDGRLMHFIREYYSSTGQLGMDFIAIDDSKPNFQSPFSLDRIGLEAALVKYEPSIVVASWMPPGVDVTQAIRRFGGVEEYLLIGEPDEGCCGDHWLTWGKSDLIKPSSWQYENEDGTFDQIAYDQAMDAYSLRYKTPPYVSDGFIRTDLDFIRQTQKCMLDYPGTPGPSLSSTVSFLRQQ